jgi:hypothetical protein
MDAEEASHEHDEAEGGAEDAVLEHFTREGVAMMAPVCEMLAVPAEEVVISPAQL